MKITAKRILVAVLALVMVFTITALPSNGLKATGPNDAITQSEEGMPGQGEGSPKNTGGSENQPGTTEVQKFTLNAQGSGEDGTDLSEPEEEPENLGPIDLNDRALFDGANLFYKEKGGNNWINITSPGAKLPGDASIRLEQKFHNVNTVRLQEQKGVVTAELPEIFKNAKTSGYILDGVEKIGTIEVIKGEKEDDPTYAKITFYEKWMEDQGDTIYGDFYVEGEVDLSYVIEHKDGKIIIGPAPIEVTYEEDIIAKHVDVSIEKNIVKEGDSDKVVFRDGKYWVEYEIKVKAGEFGAPGVLVRDAFKKIGEGEDAQLYVGNYEIITADRQIITDRSQEGRLTWEIGDMEPNEVRTLVYQVPLKDDYTGGAVIGTLKNTAEVFTKQEKEHSHGKDTAEFTPTADISINKLGGDVDADGNTTNVWFEKDQNGGGTFTYRVKIKANQNNIYDMQNVSVKDSLLDKGDAQYVQFIDYDKASFKLVSGEGESETKTTIDSSKLHFSENQKSVSIDMGTMKAGDEYVIEYKVNVSYKMIAAMGDNPGEFDNQATVSSKGKPINRDTVTSVMQNRKWARKLDGQLVGADEPNPITMTGRVYKKDDKGKFVLDETTKQFELKDNSYKYYVLANEEGGWNISSASLTDTFKKAYMNFYGYVRIDAYEIDEAIDRNLSDAQAVAAVQQKERKETVWIPISGTSFGFKPTDVGLNDNYAYLLTYYATPVKTETVMYNIIVTNDVRIDGPVGPEGSALVNTGVKASADVTVVANSEFITKKLAWYYDANDENTGFEKGALYWGIEAYARSSIGAGTVSAGTQFKDFTNVSGGRESYFRADSIVGAYIGKLDANQLDAIKAGDLNSESLGLTPVDEDKYEVSAVSGNQTDITITIKKNISLTNGNKLYIFYKTEPKSINTSSNFHNKIQTKIGEGDWYDSEKVTQYISDGIEAKKSFAWAAEYDGNNTSVFKVNKSTGSKNLPSVENYSEFKKRIKLNGLEKGTYVGWVVRVNPTNTYLNGTYTVTDKIPEGMEIARVQYLYGTGYSNKTPTMGEDSSLGDNWKKKECNDTIGGTNVSADKQKAIWYENGDEVKVVINNLKSNLKTNSANMIELVFVTRITDEDVLYGVKKGEYNNAIDLSDGTDSPPYHTEAYAEIERYAINKDADAEYVKDNPGKYKFNITLNRSGADILEGENQITLYDNIPKVLSIDDSTIKVKNILTDKELTPIEDYSVAIIEAKDFVPESEEDAIDETVGAVLVLKVPDNAPLLVSYETRINAKPGEKVSFANMAHWKGQEPGSQSTKVVTNYVYEAGGSAGSTPVIKVEKKDADFISLSLEGARFELVEMVKEDGIISDKYVKSTDPNKKWTGTTNNEGKLKFETNGKLQFNTVYCITEIEAPPEYALDSTPHYVIIAKARDGIYPNYPESINGDEVTIYYLGGTYTYQARDKRGYHDLKIVKTLKDYELQEGYETDTAKLQFAFKVEAEADMNRDGKMEDIYSNIYAGQFGAPGESAEPIVVHDLPLGSVVTITELNSGEESTYTIDGNATRTVTLLRSSDTVKFLNQYNKKNKREHGAINSFYKDDNGKWRLKRVDNADNAEN